MSRLRIGSAILLCWLLSGSARAEILHSIESIGLTAGHVMTLNAGTTRSPLEFTQPIKIAEALQVPYTLNLGTIKKTMQNKGLWLTAGMMQTLSHQFVFYPTSVAGMNVVIKETEGNLAIMQIASHPEVGISLVIKDASFPQVPITALQGQPYFCLFNIDNNMPEAACSYKNGINLANFTYTGRLYLLPPAIARDRDENAWNSAEPIVINETLVLGRLVIRQRLCASFGGCTYEQNNLYFDITAKIQVTIQPNACGLVGEKLNRTLDLGEISQLEMSQAVGPVYRNKEILLQFKCPSYANVKVSLYAEDLNDPSNNSNLLSIKKGEGYAEGVGILLQGKGPNDTSAEEIRLSKENRLPIVDTHNLTTFDYVITPHYYKTGTVKSGQIEANAKVVFQYD